MCANEHVDTYEFAADADAAAATVAAATSRPSESIQRTLGGGTPKSSNSQIKESKHLKAISKT